ncbi:MAG TPA: peptidylprolyl isomerase [Myxococcota bacterium]|nr:peptidylprolyl isomerase [Myxococcota bacterium]
MLISLFLVLFACSGQNASTPAPKPEPRPAAPATVPATAPLGAAESTGNPLLNPKAATLQAPETYEVKFETTKGDFTVKVTRAWAPLGADRFFNLVKIGYFNDAAFFRVVDGFMVQFGINGEPGVNGVWRPARIQDDPVTQSNTRGKITFATSGKNSRTTQVFINFVDNSNLDGMGFAPFGEITSGMDIVDSLYKGYGEGAPRGRGPDQGRIQGEGNSYLKAEFPQLDYVKKASVL